MKKRMSKKRMEPAELNITALLDMFTMLLIFLLINYSAVSYAIKTSGLIDFPKSYSEKKPEEILNIVVDKYNIVVDGVVVAKHNKGALSPEVIDDNGFRIIPLYDALLRYSERNKYISSVNKKVVSGGKVILQMDRDVPFSLLRQVMYTAGQAEYNDFKFIAIKK
ncbi:MAG: biopolymer transporter ExbD [Proteobacteria bacterium]|nr:biopolymer transporter ExbD [Pseudomonadota bacterium]